MNRERPDHENHEPPTAELVGERIAEARCRGTEVDVLAPRICELIATMVSEGRELFEDWEQWPRERRMGWCFNGAMERAKLEFPEVREE